MDIEIVDDMTRNYINFLFFFHTFMISSGKHAGETNMNLSSEIHPE